MPEIPVYNAGGKGLNVPHASTNVSLSRGSGIAGIGKSVTFAASALEQYADIDAKLQKTQDDMEFKRLGASYDAGVDQIMQDLERDAEVIAQPNRYFEKYDEAHSKLLRDTSKRASNDRVGILFEQYSTIKGEQATTKARAEGRKLWDRTLKGNWLIDRDMALQIAIDPMRSDSERKAAMDSWADTTGKLAAIGTLHVNDADAEVIKFRKEAHEKYWKNVAANDPEGFEMAFAQGTLKDLSPETQVRLLPMVQGLIKAKQDRAKELDNNIQTNLKDQLGRAAMQGNLIPTLEAGGTSIKDLLDGKSELNAYLDSDAIKSLIATNEKPLDGFGQTAVDALIDNFELGRFAPAGATPYDTAAIAIARRESNALFDNGVRSKKLRDFLEHINRIEEQQQAEKRTIEAAKLRAGADARDIIADQRATRNDAIKGARAAYIDALPPVTPIEVMSPLHSKKRMDQIRRDLATIDKLIRSGKSESEALEVVMGKRGGNTKTGTPMQIQGTPTQKKPVGTPQSMPETPTAIVNELLEGMR